MQKYVAVLALTLMTAAPAFAAAVTTDQSATPPSVSRTAQTPRATTPPPAQGRPYEPVLVPTTAQTPAPPAVVATQMAPGAPMAAAPVAPASAPRPPSLPPGAMAVNIKLDLVLTDNFGGTPTKKTVSMVVMNRQSGMIRTQNYVGGFQVRLDVDAAIEQHATGGTAAAPVGGGPLTLRLTLQYTPAPTEPAASKGMDRGGNIPAGLNESLAVLLQDGKPLLISQSADPTSDRRVTVEVTATVLK